MGTNPAPSCGKNELGTNAAYEGYENLIECLPPDVSIADPVYSFRSNQECSPDYYTTQIPEAEVLAILKEGIGTMSNPGVSDILPTVEQERILTDSEKEVIEILETEFSTVTTDIDRSHFSPSEPQVAFDMGTVLLALSKLLADMGKKAVSAEILNRTESAFDRGKPYKPTAKEAPIFKQLDQFADQGVIRRMNYLILEHRMTPQDAFGVAVRHILAAPRPDYAQRLLSGRHVIKNGQLAHEELLLDGLSTADVTQLRDPARPYKLTYAQMEAAIRTAAAETRSPRMGQTMLDIMDASIPRLSDAEMPIRDVDRTHTQTQEGTDRLTNKLQRSRASVTLPVLEQIIGRLEGQDNFPERMQFEFGDEKIILDLSSMPQDLRNAEMKRYVRILTVIRNRIQRKGYITDKDITFLGSLISNIEASRQFRQVRDLVGSSLQEMIAANRRGEEMLMRALDPADPVSHGIREALLTLSNPAKQSTMVGLEIEGEGVAVLAWEVDPSGQHAQLRVHDRNNANIGPTTYQEVPLVRIDKGGGIEMSPALLEIDRRGRPGILSLAELAGLQDLTIRAEDAFAKIPNGDALKKAVYQAVNERQVECMSVDWEDPHACEFEPADGSPASLSERAENIRRLGWGNELLRSVRMTSRDLEDIRLFNPDLGMDYRKVVEREFERIEKTFVERFPEAMKARFHKIIRGLAKEFIRGRKTREAVFRRELRTLVFEAMDAISGESNARNKSSIRKQAGIGEETHDLLELARLVREGEAVPQDLVQRLTIGRTNLENQPSIESARDLYMVGEHQQALAEYWRVGTDAVTPVPERAAALGDGIGVAILIGDPVAIDRTMRELEHLVIAEGHELTTEQQRQIRNALKLEAMGIAVPEGLRNALKGKIGIGWASEMANEALLGHERPLLPLTERFAYLGDEARTQIETLTQDALRGELGKWLTDKGFLRFIATSTEAEYDDLFKRNGIANGDTTNPSRPGSPIDNFYRRAREIIRASGYDLQRLAENKMVALVGDQPAGEVKFSEPPRTKIRISGEYPAVGVKAGDISDAAAQPSFVYSDTELSREIMRWPWLYDAREVAYNIRDVALPSALSVLSFLTAKNTVELIMPPPTRTWEAMAQGYSIMGAATILDHGLSAAGNYIIRRTVSDMAALETVMMPGGFSAGEFAGGMGSAIFVWRGIAGTSELMGADPKSAEMIGLGGMAAIYGGYRPLIRVVAPDVYRDIVMFPQFSRTAAETGAEFVFLSPEVSPMLLNIGRLIKIGGIIYLTADVGLGIADSVIELMGDDADAAARNIWYANMRNGIKERSFFGNASGVGFAERASNTITALNLTVTPPSLVKVCGDIFEADLHAQIKAELVATMKYAEHRYNANELANASYISLLGRFRDLVWNAIWSDNPPSLISIVSDLTNSECNETHCKFLGVLDKWQKYAQDNLSDRHQPQLFKGEAIAEGRVRDPVALASQMKEDLAATLNVIEDFLRKNADNPDSALNNRPGLLNYLAQNLRQYRQDLESMPG